jgi:hypothetical protein
MANIKLTTPDGISYPSDLQNLTYDEAVTQLNLLSQKTGHEEWELDRQCEDAICLNHTNGDYSLYEIED